MNRESRWLQANTSKTGFQISNTTDLPAVENVMASWPGSNQLKVRWDAVEDALGYRLGITGDAAGAAIEQTIDVIGTSIVLSDELLSTPLAFGETFRVEVVAIDENGGPGLTGGRAIGVVGPTDSVLPETGQLSVFAEPGTSYTGQFSLADGETISLVSGPDGSTVDGEGVFRWDVPAEASGFEELRIKIVPASGRIRYEEFVLFAGSSPNAEIGGQVIDDTDRNGTRDAGENGLSGVTIELVDLIDGTVVLSSVSVDIDLNDDDTIDPETEQGLFRFTGLAAGEYEIRRADVAAPAERLTLLDGTVENALLGQPSMSSLAGTVLDDINFDSVGDDLVQGITVFLDLDDSGSLTDGDATTLTDAGGAYQFLNLPTGELRFGVVPPTDFEVVGPTTQSITLGIDETSDENNFVIQLNPAPTNAIATARIVNALTSQSIFNALNLGEVSVDGEGGDAFSVDLQLLNLGNENLVVTSATILDSEAGVTIDGLAVGTTIVPNSLVDESSGFPFTLNFDPTQSGVIDTFLSIESNDPNSPILVRLEGLARSTGPELSVQIDNNNAGGVNFGETENVSNFLALKNIGNQPLTISEISGTLGFEPAGLPPTFPGEAIVLGVDESLNVDLLVSATQLGLQGGTLTITSDDPLNGTVTQSVLATGIPEAGPLAQIGDDFVAIELPTFSATPVLRDRTNLNGDYEFFLTSQSLFEVTLFDPDTGLIAKSLGRTSPTGNITFITQPAFIASVSPDSDGDILPDDAEFAIGTAINNPDTDGDGGDRLWRNRTGLESAKRSDRFDRSCWKPGVVRRDQRS